MTSFTPQDLVGRTQAEAEQLCAAAGRRCRVVHQDGEDLIQTADYVVGRCNLRIENGVVTGVNVEGETHPTV